MLSYLSGACHVLNTELGILLPPPHLLKEVGVAKTNKKQQQKKPDKFKGNMLFI